MSIIRNSLLHATTLAVGMFTAGQAWAVGNSLFGNLPEIGSNGDIRVTVINVIKKVLEFMALIAVVLIVVAGIRLVISQGDEGAKDTAKKTITYIIIGLVLIVFARAIVEFVAQALGV